MRPNEQGGQILENALENQLVITGLAQSGELGLAHELTERIDRSGQIKGNIIENLAINGVHEVLVLNEDETASTIDVLTRIVDGELPVEYPYQRMLAESMLNRYNGLPTLADSRLIEAEQQKKRVLPKLINLIFR